MPPCEVLALCVVGGLTPSSRKVGEKTLFAAISEQYGQKTSPPKKKHTGSRM